MKIYFICVNYNSASATMQWYESLRSQIGHGIDFETECIVVDNSSESIDSRKLSAYLADKEGVVYLSTPRNLGYFGGLNYGLEYALRDQVYFVIIGNNDLTFDTEFCLTLCGKNYGADVLAVSPDLITKDGFHQNPHVIKKRGWLQVLKLDTFFSGYYLAWIIFYLRKIFGLVKRYRSQVPGAMEIHMGLGACYVLTPAFLNRFSKLEYPYFLYGEELFFSNQIHLANGILWFDPDLRVHHTESASVSTAPKRKMYDYERICYWGSRNILLEEVRSRFRNREKR